jgi:GH25 family lysozyme M1 (1,4-beta-N-acetylmuramidase)
MEQLLYKVISNKRKILIAILIIVFLIFVIRFINKKIDDKINNIDVSNAIHGVIMEDDIGFYKKPKESKWKNIRNLEKGENAYIVDEVIDKNNQTWYKVKIKDRVGYVKKEYINYYEFSNESGKTLMSDVSKFNVIYKHFESPEDYEVFILESNINYVYIRAGGRGYGTEGNFYTDPNYQIFIDACEYLGVPYGFYYIDEAITSEEIDEEVEFINNFIKINKTEKCVLPLAIDIESHDGVGRADDIWDEREELVTELISKFNEKNIETIIYSNAKTANEYLYNIETKFWLAYYDKKEKIPNYWLSDTDQDAAQNEELMSKLIAWQFTESGAGSEINYSVDVSLVDNNFFKTFVK